MIKIIRRCGVSRGNGPIHIWSEKSGHRKVDSRGHNPVPERVNYRLNLFTILGLTGFIKWWKWGIDFGLFKDSGDLLFRKWVNII